jgi:hypothetical protein
MTDQEQQLEQWAAATAQTAEKIVEALAVSLCQLPASVASAALAGASAAIVYMHRADDTDPDKARAAFSAAFDSAFSDIVGAKS